MMSRETVPRWRFLGDISISGPDGDLTPHFGKKAVSYTHLTLPTILLV